MPDPPKNHFDRYISWSFVLMNLKLTNSLYPANYSFKHHLKKLYDQNKFLITITLNKLWNLFKYSSYP